MPEVHDWLGSVILSAVLLNMVQAIGRFLELL